MMAKPAINTGRSPTLKGILLFLTTLIKGENTIFVNPDMHECGYL